ncbi:MAG: type II toxin-antitoxin system prevent-host-death family antitoxin [Nitrospira sp.]|nr:type II toxin-antitoxin system prevent-host-death family antitoxin [Nitrospira sp.]
MHIGLREANQQFSRLMKTVRGGREVLLTERGRPLAVLRPIRSSDKTKAVVQRLEAAGFLRPASKRTGLPAWKPRPVRRRHLSKTIRQERDKR